MTSVLSLGEPVNLLDGLRPAWAGSLRGGGAPFAQPPRRPFRTLPIDAPVDDAAGWGGLTLSLHDTPDDLADAVFDYRVAPFPADPGPFRIPASTLMLGAEDRGENLAALGALLGLDLARDGSTGFILLKASRTAASFAYPVGLGGIGAAIKLADWWTLEGRNAMGRLRTSGRIREGAARDSAVGPGHAARYLDYFYNFGTHYVARAAFGDCLVQALACVPERYDELKRRLNREAGGSAASGPLLRGLRSLVGPRWVSTRGGIVSASGDPAAAEAASAGVWRDEEIGGGDCLLAGGGEPLRRLRSRAGRPAAISIEFFSQDPFMEVFRGRSWRRLLKGALLQRYFRGVTLPLPPVAGRPTPCGLAAAPAFPASGARPAAVSRDRMDLSDLESLHPGRIDGLAGFAMASGCAAPRTKFPVGRVGLCAYRFEAAAPDGEVPVLTLEERAFEDYELAFGEMDGALFVTTPDGGRRETAMDGLRYATAGRRVVAVDRPRTPSPDLLRSIGGALESSLDAAESLLFAPLVNSIDAVRFARGYLEWLSEAWAGAEGRRGLRIRALRLARAAGGFPLGKTFPRERPGVLAEDRSAVLDAAGALQTSWLLVAMRLRELRHRDLDPDAGAVAAMIGRFSSDLAAAVDALADVLARIGAREVEHLAACTSALHKLGRRAEAARGEVRASIDAIEGDPADRAAWPLGCALLREAAETPTPGEGGERPPAGGHPYFEARLILFKARQAVTAAAALELLAEPDANRSDPRVERLLEALDGPIEPPSRAEWDRLPRLVAGCFDPPPPGGRAEPLEAAVRNLADASGPWIEQRLAAARIGSHFAGFGDFSCESRGDAAESSLMLQLQSRHRRAARLLVVAWDLLRPAAEAEVAACLSTIDPAEIAQAITSSRRGA